MAELRVPSVQHLARNWRDDPVEIARALVSLARNPPQFSYNPLYGAVRDLLVLNVPYDQVAKGIATTKREVVRRSLRVCYRSSAIIFRASRRIFFKRSIGDTIQSAAA